MTIKEVATYINKLVMSMRRLIRRCDFSTPLKIGDEFRFERSDVEEWLQDKVNEGNKIYRSR
jgi:excisionase family DNA binding protein